MPDIYTTKQGQTVDLACQAYYGRTAFVTELVLQANAGLADKGAVLPLGTKIVMPAYEPNAKNDGLVKLWE